MKHTMVLAVLGVLYFLSNPNILLAGVFQSAPSEMVVLPDDGTKIAKVAFLFDLSKLRAGKNRQIDKATLEWRLNGITNEEEPPEFSVYAITGSWTKASVMEKSALSVEETRISDWQINPMAPEASEGKLISLDVTDLVGAWANGSATNYGVIVTTTDVASKSLDSQLGKVRLSIRYGFRSN